MNHQRKPLKPGEKFGRLTVVADAGLIQNPSGDSQSLSLVRCDCGKTPDFEVRNHHLRRGHTESCGCLRKEKSKMVCLSRIKRPVVGQRFGTLVVLGPAPSRVISKRTILKTVYYSRCLCDCGREVEISNFYLRSRSAKATCGVHFKEVRRDLTGRVFGLLKVISRAPNGNPNKSNPGGPVQWFCLCECGQEKIILSSNLVRGKSKSCGSQHHRDKPKTFDLDPTDFGTSVIPVQTRRTPPQRSLVFKKSHKSDPSISLEAASR